MGKNKNNLSTKIGKEFSKKLAASNDTKMNRVKPVSEGNSGSKHETRASAKRRASDPSCEGQPLPKQSKTKESKRQSKPGDPKTPAKKAIKTKSAGNKAAGNAAALGGCKCKKLGCVH